jgi:hypothetical protein
MTIATSSFVLDEQDVTRLDRPVIESSSFPAIVSSTGSASAMDRTLAAVPGVVSAFHRNLR